LRLLNYQRIEQFERKGHRFSRALDREVWWHAETFRFLKGRSRSISLLDYKAEKEFVDQVPHKVLFCVTEDERSQPPEEPRKRFAEQDDRKAAHFEFTQREDTNRNYGYLPSRSIVRSTRRALAKGIVEVETTSRDRSPEDPFLDIVRVADHTLEAAAA
jgi:hypothetical protein